MLKAAESRRFFIPLILHLGDSGEIVNLNFKVPAEFKKDFKIAAATYGCTQVELLQRVFKFWTEHHG